MIRRVLLCFLFTACFTNLQACAMAAGDLGAMMAGAAGIPQMNAFLPDRGAVIAGPVQPIDGIWTISTIAKKIRIERGRAYAVDGWLHAFTLKVLPNMVVMKDIKRSSSGNYTCQDLPLLGKCVYEQQANGSLSVVVSTMAGPARYNLLPVSVDNPVSFNADMRALGHTPVSIPRTPTSYQQPPVYSEDEPSSYQNDDDYDYREEDDEGDADDEWS